MEGVGGGGRGVVKEVMKSDSLCVCVSQLLSDASGGRLVVHHDDALEFDIARHCCNHVDSKQWDEG